MVLLETAATALDAAQVIADRTPEHLSETAKTLYTALVATAIETARRRGHVETVTHVKFHLPLEVLADVCGIHRVTAWRNLPALRELGLIDYRPHKGTLRGERRNTGCVWEVRLNPERGSRCRLGYHDLKHKWRDLQKDVYRKRTAYRQIRAVQLSDKTSTSELDVSRLLYWTLPPDLTKPTVATDSCTPDLAAILGVTGANKEDRNKLVELAASGMATALGDHSSMSWYQKLLWQILRAADRGQGDFSYQVYLAVTRAAVDRSEGFARRAGALFHSRIKQAPWFQDVMAAPPTRVGTKPVA